MSNRFYLCCVLEFASLVDLDLAEISFTVDRLLEKSGFLVLWNIESVGKNYFLVDFFLKSWITKNK